MRRVIIVIILVIISLILTACNPSTKKWTLPEYENDFYKYAVRTKEDGTKEVYLIGLTELGEKQKYLVLPSEIEGNIVMGIGYERPLIVGTKSIGELRSDLVERFYMGYPIYERGWNDNNDRAYFTNALIINWSEDVIYLNGRLGLVYTYVEYMKKEFQFGSEEGKNKIGNISYMYNYETNINDGYYWLDSYDNSLIEFIPPDPIREGYKFGGWYKDMEGIKIWKV